MALQIICSGCQQQLKLPNGFQGGNVKCPKCNMLLRAASVAATSLPATSPAASLPATSSSSSPLPVTTEEWHIQSAGGPFTTEQMKTKVANGEVRADTMVKMSHGDWTRADFFVLSFPGLSAQTPTTNRAPDLFDIRHFAIFMVAFGLLICIAVLIFQNKEQRDKQVQPGVQSKEDQQTQPFHQPQAQAAWKPQTPQQTLTPAPPQRKIVVSLDDYLAIREDMSYPDVVGLLGNPGTEQSSSYTPGVKIYEPTDFGGQRYLGETPSITTKLYVWSNSDGSAMSVIFQNSFVVNKTQVGLKKSLSPQAPLPQAPTINGTGSAQEVSSILLTLKDGKVRYAGELTASDPLINGLQHYKAFTITLEAGKIYRIEQRSDGDPKFDSYLYLKDASGKTLAKNDDLAEGNLDSQIVFRAEVTGTYSIFAATFVDKQTGKFILEIENESAETKSPRSR